MQKYFAEAFGTFVLVFAGTGAVVVNDLLGQVTHVGVALTFGLAVMALIVALGGLSGAHLNPAVTLGFCAAGRMRPAQAAPYVAAQLAGALLASAALRVLFPQHPTLGATMPAGSALQSFALEMLLTLILMVVILCVSTGSREAGMLAGIAVGGVICFEALIGGPVSGASMNPARSIAPALVSGHLESLWIYIAAPALGALLGVAVWRGLRTAEA